MYKQSNCDNKNNSNNNRGMFGNFNGGNSPCEQSTTFLCMLHKYFEKKMYDFGKVLIFCPMSNLWMYS